MPFGYQGHARRRPGSELVDSPSRRVGKPNWLRKLPCRYHQIDVARAGAILLGCLIFCPSQTVLHRRFRLYCVRQDGRCFGSHEDTASVALPNRLSMAAANSQMPSSGTTLK